jgi:glyoxylase-like metal-dependent hydrolase (beta-lactamase superfamily II)
MPEMIIIKGFTNNFLIPLTEGYLLVDTFLPTKYRRFVRQLRRKGIALKEITHLFLTHHHSDHTACLNKLREKADFTLIVHEKALNYLEKGINEEYTQPINLVTKIILPLAFVVFGKSYPPVILQEGDVVISEDTSDVLQTLLGLEALVLRTPGSTEDNLSIVFSDGVTITGDIVTNFLHFLRIKNRPPLITTMDKVFASWELLQKHGAKKLYPSHGKPLTIQELKKRKVKLIQ